MESASQNQKKGEHLFSNLTGDIAGGIMTTIVAIPVAMAFGIASGLGAAAGLYGAMICGVLAAWFGGTKGQQSGPTGPMAVVVAATLAANPDRPELAFAAISLAGVFLIVLGRLKAGEVVRYLPYPVISGFMSGIALIIITLHIHPIFGLEGPRKIWDCIMHFPDIIRGYNVNAIGISLLTFALIYGLPRISKKIPASLVALVVATTVSVVWHLNIPRIGEIPQGLPNFQFPHLSIEDLHGVVTSAISIALLGAIDSLLTSLIADKVLHSHHDSNKELVGQGIANMVAGLFGGLAGAGSTTRTLANIDAGGRTKLSGVVYGSLILAVILGLGNIAALIPKSSLAAILIALGIHIVDWRAVRRIVATSRPDVAVMLVTLGLTLFVDLIVAVGVGTAMASIFFVKSMADVQITKHGNADSLEDFHQMVEHLSEETRRSIYIYTFHGPLFFGEVKNFTATVANLSEKTRYFILRFYSFPIIDQSWSFALEDSLDQLSKRNVTAVFVGLAPLVIEKLEEMDILRKIDRRYCFDTIEEAIEKIDLDEATVNASQAMTSTLEQVDP